MASINFQSLLTTVTTDNVIRKTASVDPSKFSQSILQISDQQSRDKNYEKSLEYIRTYIASLQAKLNSLIEELNTTYELFLSQTLNRRADTKDTAKDLNRVKNVGGTDGCLVPDPSRVDPYNVRITPYSKNVYNYNYNALYASRSLDLSNYSDITKNNSTSIARSYYQDEQNLHHEFGASAFATLQYLWAWDVDRINASYATTKESYVDEGGTLHVPPGDPRAFYSNGQPVPGVVEDSALRFSAGSDPNALQVNVTALQPNRSRFGPSDLENKRENILTLDTTSSDPTAGWLTKYAHSSSKFDFLESGSARVNIVNTSDPGLSATFEGRNQWGIDNNTLHDGRATLNFGNAYTYTAYEVYHPDGTTLRDGNAKPMPIELRSTHTSYGFDPELVNATFDTAASGAAALPTGELFAVGSAGLLRSGADTSVPTRTVDRLDNGNYIAGDGVLSVGYPNSGNINNGAEVTITTPVYDLNEFDKVSTSSVNYYYVEGTLHGPGCVHPAVNVKMNPNPPGSGFPLPSTPGHDVWETIDGTGQDNMVFLKTDLPGTANTSLSFIFDNQYADNNFNRCEWLVDNIFMKARGWSAGQMISPPMDLSNYNKAFLQFSDRVVTDATKDRSEVWYCTDYNESTGVGNWKLLNKQGYTTVWRDNNIELPIECMTPTEKANLRVMFLFDTQDSQNNLGLDGWNIDNVSIVGDKKIETDFYYYRQGLDSMFVEGDGSTVLPPTNVYNSLTPLTALPGSAQISVGSSSFSNVAINNPAPSPVTINPSFATFAHDPSPLFPLDVSALPNGFRVDADSAYANIPPDPSVSGDFDSEFTSGVFDLSTSTDATLTFTHEGTGLNAVGTANLRSVQYSIDGINWYDLATYNTASISPTTTSVVIPGGSSTTRVRFTAGVGTIDDNQAGDFWNVTAAQIVTNPDSGLPATYRREATSGPYVVPAGSVMSFDSSGVNPAGIPASAIKRQAYYSNDGGATYNLLSDFSAGTLPVSTSLPTGNILLKFATEINVPSGSTAAAQANLWNINNFKIEVPSADGYNVQEVSNKNGINISFDPRRTNIEGKYTVTDNRVQIYNSDFVTFSNTLLTYIEQDPSVYNQSKVDGYAVWNGVVTEYPAEIYDIASGTKQKANDSVFSNDSLFRKFSHATSGGPITGMYLDDALAINYGLLTKNLASVPPVITLDKVNDNDTGWVNYDTSTNWFPHISGTKYEEAGNYKNMSIWGKKSFHIPSAAPPANYMVNMAVDDDSFLYVNGYLVPNENWKNWYNTTYQTWYTTTYTTWYNNFKTWYDSYVKPWNGNTNIDPMIAFDNSIEYESFPPVLDYDLHSPNYNNPPAAPNPIPNPPLVPTPPTAPEIGSNNNTQTYNIGPYLKGSSDPETGGFNTIAFKASEDYGAQGITISDTTGTYGLSTNSTWAVKVQPKGYDGTGTYTTTGGVTVNPPGKTLGTGDIFDLFKTEIPKRHSLSINFNNVDENSVGKLSEIQEIEVSIRGENIIQTYGTSTFNSNYRTSDGKMITQLVSGYIDGVLQEGLEDAQRIEPPTPVTDLNYMTDINGKALINLYIDDTKDIVNDATPLVKVRYIEDSNQDGRIFGAELTDYKYKYIGMQDLRSNTANNSKSEVADTAVAGVYNRYEKTGNDISSDIDTTKADLLYSNYFVVGKGRSGGSEDITKDVNPLTSKLKKVLDNVEYQEVLKYGLLDNIYIAATTSTQRGDQVTGKLILDWDWRRRRTEVKQGSFSAIYKG